MRVQNMQSYLYQLHITMDGTLVSQSMQNAAKDVLSRFKDEYIQHFQLGYIPVDVQVAMRDYLDEHIQALTTEMVQSSNTQLVKDMCIDAYTDVDTWDIAGTLMLKALSENDLSKLSTQTKEDNHV